MKDYYRILEVHPEASLEAIERAYRNLARRFHPDTCPADRHEWATEKMRELNEARAVLVNPQKRALYDRQRRLEPWKLFWREGLAGLARKINGR